MRNQIHHRTAQFQQMNTDSTCLYLKVKAEDCGTLVNAEGGHGARSHLTAIVIHPSGEEAFIDLDFHSRSDEVPRQHFVDHDHLADVSAHAVIVHGSVCSTAVCVLQQLAAAATVTDIWFIQQNSRPSALLSCHVGRHLSMYSYLDICGRHSRVCPSFCASMPLLWRRNVQRLFIGSAN